jgi:hypothetical protein
MTSLYNEPGSLTGILNILQFHPETAAATRSFLHPGSSPIETGNLLDRSKPHPCSRSFSACNATIEDLEDATPLTLWNTRTMISDIETHDLLCALLLQVFIEAQS